MSGPQADVLRQVQAFLVRPSPQNLSPFHAASISLCSVDGMSHTFPVSVVDRDIFF